MLQAEEPKKEAALFKKIDHVEIVTKELERSIEFYTGVLGFRVKLRERPWYVLLMFPFVYLIFGYVFTPIGCAVYNFCAGYIGGFEFEAGDQKN